jgi:hypothetical protein
VEVVLVARAPEMLEQEAQVELLLASRWEEAAEAEEEQLEVMEVSPKMFLQV